MMKKLWVILMVLCLCLGMVTTAQAEVNSGGEVDLHDLTYSAAGGVLTQTCLHDGCDHLATATLIVPESVEFTGSAVTPGEVACLDNWYGSQPTISYTGNTAPGEGSASISAGGVTAMKTFRIIGKTSTITYSMTDTGHVIGPVSAACGDTVTVMIFPAAEYELDELIVWQGATRIPVSSLDGDFTFTMPGGNVKVIPTFRKLYTIHCAESQMGTVSVNETVRYPGETVELTIDLNEGVEMSECVVVAFVTTNGAQVSMANTGDGYRFIMPSSNVMVQLLPAEVSSASYNVKWEIDGEEYARTVAQYGQVVDYVELPYRDGYLNHGWYTQPNGEGQRISMMTVFRDTSDTTYYAYYEALDADVFVDTNSDDESVLTRMNYIKVGTPIASVASIIEALVNNGTIKKTGDTFRGIKCYTDANHTTEYSETTVPTRLYVVLEWEADPYKVIVLPMENGYTVTADKSEAFSDETITLNAQTEAGWELDSFIVKDASGNDVTVSADGTFTMPASDVTVSATFRKTVYTVDVAEVLGGVVTVDKSEATMDETITLNAQTEAGWELDSFIVKDASGNDVTVSADGTFTMPASDVTVSATFRKTVYTVDVAEVIGGVVTVDKSEATMDETITVTITADEGYELSYVQWQTSGQTGPDARPEDGVYTFTMPADNVTVYAGFSAREFVVAFAETANGTITFVDGFANPFMFGEPVSLSFQPDEGCEWDETVSITGASGTDYSDRFDAASRGFTMPAEDVEVLAEFRRTDPEEQEVSLRLEWIDEAGDTLDDWIYGYIGLMMVDNLSTIEAVLPAGENTLSFDDQMVPGGYVKPEDVILKIEDGIVSSESAHAAVELADGVWLITITIESDGASDTTTRVLPAALEAIDSEGNVIEQLVSGLIGDDVVNNGNVTDVSLANGANMLMIIEVPNGYQIPGNAVIMLSGDNITTDAPHVVLELHEEYVLIRVTLEEAIDDCYTLTVVNGTGSDQFAAGTEVTISADAPEAGKQFAVWEGLEGLTIVGGSIDHETVSFIMPAHDVTATAAYEDVDAEAVTVTFHANGGEGIMAAQTFTVGVVDHLASNSFVREGCDFVTWNTAADGSGESYADGAALALNHDLVLYAQWREKDASAAVPVITAPTKAQTVTVTEGETATMAVSAENAAAWQWYINYNDGTGWHKRGSGASYTTGAVELSNSGYRYKCVVTGIGGYTDESPVFTLEVLKKIDVPQTGDATTPGLWLMLSLMSFTGLVMLIRNRQKERKE